MTDPGISFLSKTKVRKEEENIFFCGKLWDNPRFPGSPKCIQSDNVSERLFCLGKKENMNFHDIFMLVQDQIHFLTLCRACGV